MSRECTPDEYQAVSRKIAGDLGIEMFDNTTFQTNRLMFWPSISSDQDYIFKEQIGPWIDEEQGVRVIAHACWRDGAQPSLIALKRFCAERLPASMVPDAFEHRDALPKTSTDKIDYQALERA